MCPSNFSYSLFYPAVYPERVEVGREQVVIFPDKQMCEQFQDEILILSESIYNTFLLLANLADFFFYRKRKRAAGKHSVNRRAVTLLVDETLQFKAFGKRQMTIVQFAFIECFPSLFLCYSVQYRHRVYKKERGENSLNYVQGA